MSKITENAIMARGVWDNFGQADKIKKYFHLRPTNSGVTVATTLNGYEMRGRIVANAQGLEKALKDIAAAYEILVSIDEEKKAEGMKRLGFDKRGRRSVNKGANLEEVAQATMINTMSCDLNLARALRAQWIEFIASEVILEAGNHRVDIIGFDREAKILYLFELKKGRTLKVEQVLGYVKYYESEKVKRELENLLKAYPINAVDEIKKIKGVMVMRYAENSNARWDEIEEKTGVDILFYRPSLAYIKYV
jgi:hypothetical protein